MGKFRRRFPVLLGYLLIMAGAAVKLYPEVSNLYLEAAADEEIAEYNQAVEKTKETKSKVSYNDLLEITDAIGYLEIPKIDVYLPVYEGVEEKKLERGVGHIKETSPPLGGESTHCVLSGHTGLPSAKLFTHLDEMAEGDKFYIHVLDQVLAYRVDNIVTVLPENTDEIQITEGKDYVTLLTCVPYGINSHRLLVRGERTEETAEKLSLKAGKKEEKHISTGLVMAGTGAAVTAVFIIPVILAVFLPEKKANGKDEK